MIRPRQETIQHALNSPGRSVAVRVRGGLWRVMVLGAWFVSGVALAQNAGPVDLTGTGGVESVYDSNATVGTGGVVTTFGAYTIHEFEIGANFNPPAGVVQVDVLVVGGGGGGGGDQQGGGGGGAGGLVWTLNVPVVPGTNYPVVIGAAGAAGSGTGSGGTGGASSFNGTIVGNGGGGGGRGDTSVVGVAGGSGGGGGGGDDANVNRAGGTATQGNSGGAGTSSTATANDRRGGGGGGAALVGGTGGTGTAGAGGVGGAGGAARDFSALLGTNVGVAGFFAGGGGGGKQVGTGGAGGGGGGGAGSGTAGAPTAGTANTGGGGGGRGGATDNQAGAAGGTGVVVVRYLTPIDDNYIVHRFDVNNPGPFTPPEGVSAADVLVVAGGGSGGGDQIGGGGGGAGGLIWTPNVGMAVTPYTITIGAGGSPSTTVGDNGDGSAFDSITTTGGGGGGHGEAASAAAGAGVAGGSGGGGGGTGGANGAGGAGTTGQGNAGALGTHSGNNNNDRGGGGGGAGGAGTVGDQNVSGAGGVGRNFSTLLGTAVGASGWFAGGGGGGNRTSGTGGPGGTGGGGAGGTGIGTAGTLGTGGGGGGTGGTTNNTSSAAGGSGAVVVRYRPPTMEIDSQVTASNVLSGVVFPQSIVIEILDSSGAGVSGVDVTAALSFGAGTLGGTLTRTTNGSGLATFNDLMITGAVGNRRISFTAENSAETVETNNISVASITMSVQPPTMVLSGQTFPATMPTVLVQNGSGPISGVDVTVAIQSGAGTLSGTTVVATNGSGLAAFNNIAITGAVGNRTLRFTPDFSTGNVVSNAISVASMTVTQQPTASVMSGQTIPQPPIIEIVDGNGAVSGVNVTASLGAGAGTLGGTLVVATNGSGQASFSNLQITGVTGFRTLRFTPAFSTAFVDATQLSVAAMAISQQPSPTALSAAVISQAPTIQILDASGNPRVGINVTAAIETGTGILGGTVTVATNGSGLAVFNNLTITGTGNHTLSFTAAGSAVEVVSNTVSIVTYRFEISHDLSAGACAPEQIQISVYDSNDALVTDYVGGVTLSSSGVTNGNWSKTSTPTDANGTLTNPPLNDGIATYNFVLDDAGTIIVNFQGNVGTVNFNVVADLGNVTPPSAPDDADLVIYSCSFRISHDEAGSVCSPEQITIGVYANNALVNYVGNINLSTAGVTGGNWTKTSTPTDANGTLTNDPPNDGAATYAFLATDTGEIILNFQAGSAGTANFNIVAAGVTAPASPDDDNLVITACTFRITHSGSTDVCSIELVTITLVNNVGTPVTNYTGTINLTTNGFGSWSKTDTATDAEGTLTDSVLEDSGGNASYLFVPADLGTITLEFRHMTESGVININVSDGVTLDPRNFADTYDQNITVGICTFEISHSLEATACELEAVTFTVRDSLGAVAEDYIGTMTLSTQTNHGNWLVNAADGSLVDFAGDDNGAATYTFVESDLGIAVFNFGNPHSEGVNFNAVDGDILVDVGEDPSLLVSSCLPEVVGDAACVVGTSTSLTITAESPIVTQRGRMVLMIIAGAGAGSPAVNNFPTFNSVNMTFIEREINATDEGSVVEMWGILDSALPDTAGSYTGSYSGGVTGSAMCMLFVDQVAQAFPVADSPANTGPLNKTQGAADDIIATTITTTANNSLVVAATNMDGGDDGFHVFRSFASPSPIEFMAREWGQGAPSANPGTPFSRFAGAAGRQPSASIVTISEDFSIDSAVSTQIVAAFEPLVSGTPLAGNYDPVIIYKTMSGNLSYRAIGNTLRTTFNETGPAPLGCQFVDFAVGSEASLTLPIGSTVEGAYLYWGGSGDPEDPLQADDDVSFGLTGSEIPLTAELMFGIENVGIGNAYDYFAGFYDVTDYVTGDGDYTLKDLSVQYNVAPWNGTNQSCAGGWALVVVFSHPNERLRVLNLFHGFQPFRLSSFTLVPRNFRMAARDPANNLPNGQVTHITLEGDETLNAVDENEGLGIQDEPDGTTFSPITSSLNPLGEEFNSTITRPVYEYDAITDYFEWDDDGGVNGDGYEIDFPGPDVIESGRVGDRIGNSWGIDVDTHYIQGANSGEYLYEFAAPGAEAEQITTRYSAADDLVLLISEVISVTNFPVADLEVFKTQVGTFKVNGTGTYQIEVTNNGNGGVNGGFADGEVIVADILPAGMTFASAGDVSGDDWACSVTLDPGAFTCTYDIAADWQDGANPGELAADESLPIITVNVEIGDSSFFPLQNNNAKNSIRMTHTGGNCDAADDGVIPDPESCDRSPQFDNFNDLEGGNIDINDLDDKQVNNNNVHSVTTVVKGVEVDLQMDKFVEDILEEGEEGVYTLRITNNGPDATTADFTVADVDPVGVEFLSASSVDVEWSCPTPPGNLACTFTGSLGVGESTDILLTVDVTGGDGYPVSNSATVTAGPYNFDVVPGNNTDTDITEITGAPVASQEKFLLSVSSLGELTSIGGLSNFEDDDYIIYDPQSDTATMFFDNSALGFDVRDADAVHLMKNGHIVISADQAGSTVGSNNLAFEPGDLVVFDPILGTARMLFDGSTIFGGVGSPADVNITAVYLQGDCALNPTPYNCIMIFAATPAAGGSTIDGVPFTSADLIMYNPDTGDASLFFEGADYFDDTTDVTINGFYLRDDPATANGNIDTLILSVRDANDDTITLGATVGWEPETGTLFTQDDVTEIDLDAEETQNLFLGDVELGIFDSTGDEADLFIDALHVLEDTYTGHFRISDAGGNPTVCSNTGMEIRVSKHEGLTHTRDTDYFGTVRLTTNTGIGDWTLISGGGTLANGTADDGAATYTYVPGDGGTVVLALSQSVAGSVNVDVTNGIVREGHPPGTGSEAPVFNFAEGVTLNYLDNFDVISYANQNGTNAWAGDWVENDLTAGPVAGDVRVTGGDAVFRRIGGTTNPSLLRAIDLSGAPLDSDLILSFDYAWANIGTFEEFIVEARHTSVGDPAWEQVALYKRGTTLPNTASGNAASGNLNITTAIAPEDPTASTQIRFRVVQGYTGGTMSFSIDDVRLTATTTECDISPLGVNHYEIDINGTTSGTVNGVACLASDVTITAHDVGHNPLLPGAIPIMLTTSTNRGSWSRVLVGDGNLNETGTLTDGAATYTFPADEESVTLRFDYTGPSTDPEVVNIEVTDGTAEELSPAEDPNLSVSQVGLRILNTGTDDAVTPIPLQIAGKASNVNPIASILIVQVVNSSGTNPGVCEPLFDVGQTLQFEFAAECDDPTACVTATETFEVNGTEVPLIDDGDPVNHTAVDITLQDYAGEPGAPIVINYSDVGRMRLHTRFDIPLSDDVDPLLATKSGDTLDRVSNQFIVRPFGFDIDFNNDRQNNVDASLAVDHNGTRWRIAGAPFDTTITSVGWEQGDDVNNDGVPDAGADLAANHVTPNFDLDSDADDYSVLLTVTDNKVPGGILGELTNDGFDNFAIGAATHSINYNEVGIIDMQASIVDDSDVEIPYLGTENVRGNVLNVGRFYPNLFTVTDTVLSSRANAACTPASSFTYMDEAFGLELELTAKGLTGGGTYTTVNYRGDYAKLDTFAELGLVAIRDIAGASDVNFTSRLANVSIPSTFGGTWNNGILTLTGNMMLERDDPAVPDGPYANMRIAFLPAESGDAGVTIDPERNGLASTGILNVDLDVFPAEPGTNAYYLIDDHEFRYGRIFINNAYGPETEDLALTFLVEYFNGSEFVRNTLDNCTFIDVDDLSYVGGTYTGDLADGETTLTSPDTVTFLEGQTQGIENIPSPTDDPLITSAPGEGNSGTVDIELDLTAAGLGYLGFEWDDTDDDYNENPQGQIEFGQFRNHDRVINWQEIYNRPTP